MQTSWNHHLRLLETTSPASSNQPLLSDFVKELKQETLGDCKLNADSCVPLKPEQNRQAVSERNYLIMQNFAKAIWNVLKQQNAKLKVAEVELQSLKENLGCEKKKNLDLQRELNDLKACCTRCKGGKVKIDLESQLELDAHESTNIDEVKVKDGTVDPDLNKINCFEKRLKYEAIMGGSDYDMNNSSILCCDNSILRASKNLLASEHYAENKVKSKYDKTNYSKTDLIFSPSQSCSIMRDNSSLVEIDQPHSLEQKKSFNAQASLEEDVSVVQSPLPEEPRAGTSYRRVDAEKSDREVGASPLKRGELDSFEVKVENTIPTESLVSTTLPRNEMTNDSPPEDFASTKACETRVNNSSNREKPKRRLMPSSTILLKDMSSLDLADGTEKSKGNRGIRKSTADDLKRTNGSISLLRLLKSNSVP